MKPPIIFSGYNYSNFNPVLTYLWDSGISGMRAVTPSDLGSTASINVTGDLVVNTQDIENLLTSGLYDPSGNVLLSEIFAQLLNGTSAVNVSNAVKTQPVAASGVNGNAIITSNGTVFNPNVNRVGYGIQNLNTGTLFVKLGSGCSPASFSMILSAGNNVDDGKGGILTEDQVTFTGAFSASGVGNTRFVAWEVSN